MRRHKPDRESTKERFKSGRYLSKLSFVDVHGHEFLDGHDWFVRHDAALVRDSWRCVRPDCFRKPVAVHHKLHKGRGGSDDLDNLETLCDFHHKQYHPQVQWSAKA